MKRLKIFASSILTLAILANVGMAVSANASSINSISQSSYEVFSGLEPYINATKEINKELGSNFGLLSENYEFAYSRVNSMSIEEFKNSLRQSFSENKEIVKNHAVAMPSPINYDSNITKTVIDHGNGNIEEVFTKSTDSADNRFIREDVMRQEHVVASSYF